MYEEEYRQIKDTLQRLQVDSNAKIVFLVDKTVNRSRRTAT